MRFVTCATGRGHVSNPVTDPATNLPMSPRRRKSLEGDLSASEICSLRGLRLLQCLFRPDDRCQRRGGPIGGTVAATNWPGETGPATGPTASAKGATVASITRIDAR